MRLKILLAVCFLLTPVLAQTPSAALAACGPDNIHFKVKTRRGQHPVAAVEPGKALVYVAQEMTNACFFCVGTTVRIGLDGAWMGANHGSSYFFFSVSPGEHHLCAGWQDSSGIPPAISLVKLTAEAGKTYFFRARMTDTDPSGHVIISLGPAWILDLTPVDPDEGKLLVESYPFSTSQPKK